MGLIVQTVISLTVNLWYEFQRKQGLKISILARIFFQPRVMPQHKIKVKIKTDNLETEMVMDRTETLETETVEMETLETVVMVETQAVKVI